MVKRIRNRRRRTANKRLEVNLDGLELDLTFEDVIADLNFGVGTLSDKALTETWDMAEVERVA